MIKKPIAFFDRDGIINKDLGYVASPERVEWVLGSAKAIKYCKEKGFVVVIVTNQAGIARGYYSEEAFLSFMSWMMAQLAKEGAFIDKYYYCPFHPEGSVKEYKKESNMRKPKPGMLLQAMRDFGPAAENSFLIGDKQSDLEAAKNCGVRSFLFNEDENLFDFVKKLI